MADDHHEDRLTMPVPDLDELLQQSPEDIPRVPVSMEQGTVYRLPARRSVLSTDTVGDTTWINVASANPRRNRLTLVSHGEPIYISRDGRSTGTIWPEDVPYVIEHADSVFVKCATGSATTLVGVTAELWAD